MSTLRRLCPVWPGRALAAARQWPQPVLVRRLLLLSAVFMVAGYMWVLGSGAVFDVRSGEGYDPARRWVSDYAARWPEGLLIKFSIALFCVAVWQVLRQQRPPGWRLPALLMTGGLVLVALFDMSPQAYEFRHANWLFRLFGYEGKYEAVPRSEWEWIMRTQHQWGFRLFVAGFFIAGLALAWRSPLRRAGMIHGAVLASALVLAVWLFAAKGSVPGIPQRSLLLLMFAWVWWLAAQPAALADAPASRLR
jgi:hypothetical protein